MTIWRRGVAVLVAVLVSEPAFAAAGPAPSDTWLGLPRWVWLLANLVIFWGLLIRLAGPGVRRYLDQRAERIAADLRDAETKRSETETMRSDLERTLEDMRREVAELGRRAEAAGNLERDSVLERAAHEQAQLALQTRLEIETRTAQAKAEMRRFAALLAAKLAGERLLRTLSAEDRARYFTSGLDLLEREMENAGT